MGFNHLHKQHSTVWYFPDLEIVFPLLCGMRGTNRGEFIQISLPKKIYSYFWWKLGLRVCAENRCLRNMSVSGTLLLI